MAKNNNILILGIIVLLAVALFIGPQLGLFSTSGNSMTRAGPDKVTPGSDFTITYTVSSTNDKWGASIVDSVSGGCTFSNGGTDYQDVLLSDASNTRTVTVSAPTSPGSCTFSGDYKFGEEANVNFPDLTVLVNTTQNGGDDNQTQEDTNQTGDNNQTETVDDTTVDEGELEWYEKEVFKINDFSVKMWMLLSAVGAVVLLLLGVGRR